MRYCRFYALVVACLFFLINIRANADVPLISSVSSTGDVVRVSFSTPLQPASATNPANYAITNAYASATVLKATLSTNGQTVDLTTSGQWPFWKHWLTVNGVADATGTNVISPDSQGVYTNVGFTTGYVKSDFWLGIGGASIASLTNNANYPNKPTRTSYYNISYWYDNTVGGNYGNRMSGYFVAPQTGAYIFETYSAGTTALFLSTNEDASLKKQIVAGSGNLSVPITLVAGQHYYFESLVKEGSSASDYMYIAWQTPDGTWTLINGDQMGNYLSDSTAAISIQQQPTNTSTFDARTATFIVRASISSKIVTTPSYQWQVNGTNIPGATAATYTTPLLYGANNGDRYRVIITVPGVSVMSSAATVTIKRDTTPPFVSMIENFGDSKVQLAYSKPVDPVTATDVSHYVFTNGLQVVGASIDQSNTTVTLVTGQLLYGSNYSIIINGVQDQAWIPNTIATNTVASFVAGGPLTTNIGKSTITSVITLTNDTLIVSAGGTNIGANYDQFCFNAQLCSSDFDLRLHVIGLSPSDLWAKVGLMARENLTPGSRFVATLATPSMNGIFMQSRDMVSGSATITGGFAVNYPNTWIRLQRWGNYFIGYAGYDGHTWTQLGAISSAMSSNVYVGLAISSHNNTQPTVVQFSDYGDAAPEFQEGTPEPPPNEPMGPSSRKTPITISEIMYKPAPRKDNRNLEFIELYNSNPWFHDISGYRLVADNLSYTFPPKTQIAGGSFICVAAEPASIQAVYGITNVMGAYQGSLKKSGTLRLIDEQGAVLLTVPYSNLYPWPVAADGTGHSIVLANPTYGEGDPQAWTISDSVGGSPGSVETYRPNPLRNVVINEILAHSELEGVFDFVELYNHSNQTNDLSGCILTDDPQRDKFVIPLGTKIPPGGYLSYDELQLGFALDAQGETIYLITPDHSRVLDAMQFEGQADGVSFGRWPDGANALYPLATRTPGTNNSAILIGDVVINELMYNPISGNDDDQYIELYNKGAKAVQLGNWQFTAGISYTFPTNASIAPGAYLVLARNKANLLGKYPSLNANNTFGDFTGKLSHDGERIALATPQTLNGTSVVYVVQDEVTYGTGGQWGQWSSGGGSSLELIDPRSNHRLPSNWTDSDETQKSQWTTIEATGVLDNGKNYGGGSTIGYAQLGLLDVGECLVDAVEVHANSGSANYVNNPDFENGLTSWRLDGCMSRSSLENTGVASGHSLHVRCSDRFFTGANSCQVSLTANSLSPGQPATLRFKARWLRGWPEVLMRLNGNWLEATGALPVPTNLGTPGARNSRADSNAGPAIYDVTHSPTIPAYGQDVKVTARVHDTEGLKQLMLNYRSDYDSSYITVPMNDGGTNGDSFAGDGLYTAILPGGYGMYEFIISATDKLGATNRFPALLDNNAPVRECLVRFGDVDPAGSFGVYHFWVSESNVQEWSAMPNLSNEMHDGTFVTGKRVIYNMAGRFAGSPYHQNYYRPDTDVCHFKWMFPDDDKFLGATSFNKIHAPGNGAGDDASFQREQTANLFLRALGVPWLNRRFVVVYVNGNRNSPIMEDAQTPDADIVKEYFPDDTDGYLYKMQPWFEFSPNTGSSYIGFENEAWCSLMPYVTTGGVKKTARYRYNFLSRRTVDSANNFTNVFSLVDAVSSYSSPSFVDNIENMADMENWMRVFAANHAAGNWDSFGAQNAQNLYGYIGTHGTRYSLLMFDFNIVLGNAGSWGPGANLFFVNSADSNTARLFTTPIFRRMYWRALQELINGPLDPASTGPLLDAKYNAMVASGISPENPSGIKGWLSSARSSISSQLAVENATTFTVTPTVSVANNVAQVTGTAPVGVKTVLINGVEWPITWMNVKSWRVLVPLTPGNNILNVVGVDVHGQPITGTSNVVSTFLPGEETSPVGHLVINEIMYRPLIPDAQYIELFNTLTNVAFDLSGWTIEPVGYLFPPGSMMSPNSVLTVALNQQAFAAAYGARLPLFGMFPVPLPNDAGTISLVKPGSNGDPDLVVAAVRYESSAPWPAAAYGTGASLQLIDPTQDNWRLGNWCSTNAPRALSPTIPNMTQSSLPPFPSLWINEVQPENLTGITNSAGVRSPWIELYNPSTNDVSLAGLYLANDYSNLLAWAFPEDAMIRSHEFKLIFADGQTGMSTSNEIHAGFALVPGTGGVTISMTNTNGAPLILDYINYTNVPANRSFGSYPDGQSFLRQPFAFVTPGAANNNANPAFPIAINEWMAGNTHTLTNAVTKSCDDWFELYNYGTNTVDLSGCYLTHTDTNAAEFQIPSGYSIPPHGFLLVWADRKETNRTAELHTNFKLKKAGCSIGLFAADLSPIDFVTFGPQTSDISMGRYPDGASDIFVMSSPSPAASNLWTNSPPSLAGIKDCVVTLGQTLTFVATASDPDAPPQMLTFSLLPGAPSGASITPGGVFTWTPTDAPSTNSLTIMVNDNGVPGLGSVQKFNITVVPTPTMAGVVINDTQFTLTWPTCIGQNYQVEYCNDLSDPSWIPLGTRVIGTGDPLVITNQISNASTRFFRLHIVP